MYRTRSKNEYFTYLDKPYTIAFKHVEFGSNSVVDKADAQFKLGSQSWLIPNTGMSLICPVDVFIPNSYFIEVSFKIKTDFNTVIFSNWNTNKQTNYYVWYDALSGDLKLTYRVNTSTQTLNIASINLDTEYCLGIYAALNQTAVYLNGTDLEFNSFVLPQLFNLDFSFNKSVNNVNNAGSELNLNYFTLKQVVAKPLNYTPEELTLGLENYQFNQERSKTRISFASYLLPPARVGDIFALPSVDVLPISLSLNLLTSSATTTVGNVSFIELSTASLQLQSNLTANSSLSSNLVTQSVLLDALTNVLQNTSLQANLSSNSAQIQSELAIYLALHAQLATNAASLTSTTNIFTPANAQVQLSTSSLVLQATVKPVVNTKVNAELTTASAQVTANFLVESSLNTQAALFLNALTATYSNAEQVRISQFFDAIQTAGIYDKLDRLFITIGKNSPDMRRCWRSRTLAGEFGNINAVLGDSFITRRVNSPIPSYIDTGFIASTPGNVYQLHSCSLFIGIKQRYADAFVSEGHTPVYIGGYPSASTSVHSAIMDFPSNSATIAFMNSSNHAQVSTRATTDGNILGARDSATSQRINVNGTASTSTHSTNLGLTSTNTFTIGEHRTVSSPYSPQGQSNIRFKYAGIGGHLTDSEFTTLYTEINNLINDLNNLREDREITLTFENVLDTNDIFYFIGTQHYKKAFKNPALFGDVKAQRSSDLAFHGMAEDTISYGDLRHSVVGVYTRNIPNSWIKYDLGVDYQAQIVSYAIQARGDYHGNYMRNWKLQGSNDDVNWTDIDVRVNDTSHSSLLAWGHWTVTVPNAGYFRYFRILQTGVESSSQHYLGFVWIKLYGNLKYKERLFGTVNVNETFTYSFNGDSNGVFYWLGTDRGRISVFGNPQLKGTLSVRQSSGEAYVSRPGCMVLTDRQGSQGHHALTANISNQYYIFDLHPFSLVMTAYSIKSGGSGYYPRSWKLQGSNNGYTWTDLDTKTNDTTLNSSHQWATWSISTTESFKMFRFLNTGLNSSGDNYLNLGQVEFYGQLTGTVVE